MSKKFMRLIKHVKLVDWSGGRMVRRKLELVFIDKDGKWYPLDEVNREELAEGLEKISKEAAKRLQLLREQR
jgi:hypothetical protein